jgi:hypothetical protein
MQNLRYSFFHVHSKNVGKKLAEKNGLTSFAQFRLAMASATERRNAAS